MDKPDIGSKLRLGFIVFGGLMVLEVIEYVVGVSITRGSWPFLALLAIPGSGLIINYFMHVTQLWRREE